MTVTLTQLIERVRQRTDTVNSDFVTDAEITQLLNCSYNELYGLLVTKSLHRQETSYVLTLTGAAEYAMPSDFFALIGAYRTVGDDMVPLERFPDKFQPGTRSGDAMMYRVHGTRLVLYPIPSSGTYTVVYIPLPGVMTDGTDTMDGVLGWEEFVVIDTAIQVLDKEESNTMHLEVKRDRILRRINDESQAVEFTETPRILNVRDGWRSISDPADWTGPTDDWDF